MAKLTHKVGGKKALKDLQRIEELLQTTKQNNKSDLIEKAKQTQQTIKDKVNQSILKYGNNEVNVNSITLTDHALERAIERMSLKRTQPNEVTTYIRKLLLKSDYLGRITAQDGNESEMFIIGKHSIHYSPQLNKVVTVIKYDKLPYSPAQDKVRSLLHKEFRKLTRSERARIRQLKEYRLEANVEISELNLRKYRTRSDSVKMSCDARIKAIHMRIEELEEEIGILKDSKRQVAYSLASVI